MTEATVYRTLEFLAENGVVLSALNGNGHLVYEIAGHDHHHLICRSCGMKLRNRTWRSSKSSIKTGESKRLPVE